MKFSIVTKIPWRPCKSVWQINNTDNLPQEKIITDFINNRGISDVARVFDDQALIEHDMHVLIINEGIHELTKLSQMIKHVADHSRQYIWISVNKFLIYTNTINQYFLDCPDQDLRLLEFISSQLPEWKILHKTFRSDDHGQLGNFQYPITALAAQRV